MIKEWEGHIIERHRKKRKDNWVNGLRCGSVKWPVIEDGWRKGRVRSLKRAEGEENTMKTKGIIAGLRGRVRVLQDSSKEVLRGGERKLNRERGRKLSGKAVLHSRKERKKKTSREEAIDSTSWPPGET